MFSDGHLGVSKVGRSSCLFISVFSIEQAGAYAPRLQTRGNLWLDFVRRSGHGPAKMANFYCLLANFCCRRYVRRNSSDFSKRARFVISEGGSMPKSSNQSSGGVCCKRLVSHSIA